MERKYRKKSTHLELDTLIPIDHKSVMQQDKQVHADSCFSHLWDVTTKACSLCADSEVCGILFHQRLKKRVAKLESSMPVTLDMNDFDGIDRNRLALWLSAERRTFKDLVAHVDSMANCADKETVKLWAKSFVVDSGRYTIKNGIVIRK